MSANDNASGGLRTVTPLSNTRQNSEMNAVGWLMLALVAIVLLPLIPVLAVLWLVARAIGP